MQPLRPHGSVPGPGAAALYIVTVSEMAGLDPTKLFPKEDDVLIEGFLDKRGDWNKAWKPRYFVLESCGKLSYFQSEADKAVPERAKGSIPINTSITVKEGAPADGKSVIEITIPASGLTSPKRTFIMGSGSPAVVQEWLNHIGRLQKRVHYVTFQEGVRHW